MFGKRDNKIHVTLTTDNSVDKRAVRDYLIDVVFKRMNFIRHASASFGIFSNNVAAEDYEASRAYESRAQELVDGEVWFSEMEDLQNRVEELRDEIEIKIIGEQNV